MLPIPPSNPSVAATYAWFHSEDVLAEAASARLARIAGLSSRRGRCAPRFGVGQAIARLLDRVPPLAWRRHPVAAAATQE